MIQDDHGSMLSVLPSRMFQGLAFTFVNRLPLLVVVVVTPGVVVVVAADLDARIGQIRAAVVKLFE